MIYTPSFSETSPTRKCVIPIIYIFSITFEFRMRERKLEDELSKLFDDLEDFPETQEPQHSGLFSPIPAQPGPDMGVTPTDDDSRDLERSPKTGQGLEDDLGLATHI